MKADHEARERADEAHRRIDAQDDRITDLRDLVHKASLDAEEARINTTAGGAGGGRVTMVSPTFTATNTRLLGADSAHDAVRVAVLTVVLCYENLRDALQFDTWGGLQDATSLDERAQVLRGWLGTIAVVEMEAATACYDELAGT